MSSLVSKLRTLSCVVVALALGVPSARALAVEITSAGQRFDVVFGGDARSRSTAGLSGRAEFEVVALSGNRIVLDVTLTNTSDSVLWPHARISEFGFESGSSVASGALGEDASRRTRAYVHAGRGHHDACRTDDGVLCSFHGRGTLSAGESRTMQLTLELDPSRAGFDLDRFSVRYGRSRSLAIGVVEKDSAGDVPSTNPIPEPRSIALFLAGVAAVAFAARKRELTAR